MIIKEIKTEHKDERTGLVVKRIITSEGETLNRKIAVNNLLFSCEQGRLKEKKPILNSLFQIHHIFLNNKRRTWEFEKMNESKSHAGKFGRIFLPFQQRKNSLWKDLTFTEAEADFQDLLTRGLLLVPYSIPLNADLEEWKKRKEEAISLLNPIQKLVPIFCSKHNTDFFEEIFNYEFENSEFIGVQCYSLNDSGTFLNLLKIKSRNAMLQTGDKAPLLIGLNFDKVLKSFSRVSGTFAYSCFGFDVLSCRQLCLENMPPKVMKQILSKNIEEIMRYDRTLGGFNLSAEQEFWDGVNLTKVFLENVNLTEGLSPYQAIQWANHVGQQKDLDILNDYLIETTIEGNEDLVSNYLGTEKEKWAVFWKTKILKAKL